MQNSIREEIGGELEPKKLIEDFMITKVIHISLKKLVVKN